MKLNNFLMKLIILSFIFVNIGWSASFGVNPSSPNTGENFTAFFNGDVDVSSGKTIKVKFSSGITFYQTMGGGPRNWSKSYVATNTPGSQTVYFALYEGDNKIGDLASKTFTVVASTLNPPTGISATDGTYTDKVKVSWNSVSGATDYKIYRSQYSSSGFLYLSSDGASPYYDTSATAGITYYYKIKSYNSSSGSSELSSSYDSGYKEVTLPTVSSVSPTSATSGESKTFTVYGSNLPSTIALSLEGSSCGDEFSVTSTSAKVTCNVSTTGNKRFYVAQTAGGSAISGSSNFYVNVTSAQAPTPTPTVSSVSPTSATSGESKTFTVYGSNLPSTIALSLEGSSCGDEFSVTSTSAKVTCNVSTTGNKRFYVAQTAGGSAISGSSNFYVNVTSVTGDNPPALTINTTGSGNNNPKTSNFNLNISVDDDIGTKAVAFVVKTIYNGSTGLSGVENLSGTSDSASFTIDVNSLNTGSYKIQILATDIKPQPSIEKWYLFQKIDEIDNQPIMVFDSDTNLDWAILPEDLTWKESITKCENLVTSEGSNWRTPNINELYSITDLSKSTKFVKNSLNDVHEKMYWSSTTNPNNYSQAMGVNFAGNSTYATTSNKSIKLGTICVE